MGTGKPYKMRFDELENLIDEQLLALSGDVSLYVKFLKTNETVKFNENQQIWAASVIKIPIVCEFYRQVEEKRIDLSSKVIIKDTNRVEGSGVAKLLHKELQYTYNDLVTLMLAVSDNSATNEIVDLIGWENVEKYMHQLKLTDTTYRHKMMITAGRGPNLTTASDVTLLLEMLYKKTIPGSHQIINILKKQQDRTRIPLYLPNDIEIAHKTGSLEYAMHDVGIIFTKNDFIFSFLSDDQVNKRLTNEVLSSIAKFCFEYAFE